MTTALILGLVIGAVLGLVGAGGSIVAVPALVYGVGMGTAEAIPTSLLVVGASSAAAVLPRLRGQINIPIALAVGAAGIPAAWAGTAAGRLVDQDILMLAFAAIMVLAGIRMLGKTRESTGPCSPAGGTAWRPCLPRALSVGLLVGFLTGLLGVGGGFLITPALTLFLGLGMAQAVGTSLLIIVINSVAGFSAHAAGFAIDWPMVLSFALPAVLASLLAARLANRFKEKHIRATFATLIFTVAAGVTATTLASLAA